MPDAQIIDVVNFMPERVVKVGDDLVGEDSPFYRGVRERRFASPDYLSEDLGALVTQRLLERTETRPEDIDLIIVSCIFTDTFWPGIGPAIQHRVGARNATILNIDTSCSSYLSGLNAARAYIESGQCRKVAVVTVTNFISRLAEHQQRKSGAPLGDGASATLVAAGTPSFLAAHERSRGENYGIFRFEPDLMDGVFRNYWERGCGPITVNFSEEMIDRIRENAQRLVPEAVLLCLQKAGMAPEQVDLLITHQPNDLFLKDWRDRIGIQAPRVHDTLAKYGNMFQGTIPVTLADAIENGRVAKGDVLALGTFSNGGDFVSALVIRWQ
jgi:3-oxoacyl-[acyl-carrier-protein] synthase III